MTDVYRSTTCCFTGHRAAKLPWGYDENAPACIALKLALRDVLAAVYSAGYRHFICGMANGSDTYFGEAVIALRDEHPQVTLEAAVPFDGQDRTWPPAARKRYNRLALECDRITVLRPDYSPGCMMERNRYMVDRSHLLIAVYDGRPGGTKSTIDYAASEGLEILQLPVIGAATLNPGPG